MKNIKHFYFSLILIVFFGYTCQAHVKLNYPHGGENLYVGKIIVITWEEEIAHITENWDLLFSPDNGDTWQTIEEDISSESLTFMWEVVPDIPTSLGRIKIIQDNQILDYEDESSPFTIQRTTTSTLELHENRKPLLVSVFNAPNPFNNQTTISFTVLRKTDVSINIYDCTGSHVATLEQGSLLPDTYKYLWIADHFSSGIYVVRFQVGKEILVRRLILAR